MPRKTVSGKVQETGTVMASMRPRPDAAENPADSEQTVPVGELQ